MKQTPLFNPRVLRNLVRDALSHGLFVPPAAKVRIEHWIDQLERGTFNRLTESQAEQTFNNEIFGTVLGYQQVGSVVEATFMPKATTRRNTPDFVLGRFDPTAGVNEWACVGEIKDAKTDLDQPQVGRINRETPVEQGFRYAGIKPGVEWVIITNLKTVRLYKNGYSASFHEWQLAEFRDPDRLFEFYALTRPEGLLNRGHEPLATRVFKESIAVGRDLTEGFYSLYKLVQEELIDILRAQPAGATLTPIELYGKTHKLLNRVLFVAFCEDHPATLIPRETLRQLILRAKAQRREGAYWEEFRILFATLNVGGGLGGMALNAFNGGLFAHDPFFDAIAIPNAAFEKRFRSGRGRRQSKEIIGIFGFEVYDFAEDLNEQALGAILEQSLKDISSGPSFVRGVGEIDVSNQQSGGVFYTPREITSYLLQNALAASFSSLQEAAAEDVAAHPRIGKGRGSEQRREIFQLEAYAKRLSDLKVMDPACGSGAFLVEALGQLQTEQEKVNRALAALRGSGHQRSLLDLDRLILRRNLYGRDILTESVEISKLSIWLRTAKRGEKLEALDGTITTGDTLRARLRRPLSTAIV